MHEKVIETVQRVCKATMSTSCASFMLFVFLLLTIMTMDPRRDPEHLLKQIEEEERRSKRGRLKVFLGYASGVGKSAKMFNEGRRRRERGEDVVVGAIQPKSSGEVEELLSKHEIIPTLKIAGKDVLDIDRILRRHPQVVLI